MSVGRHPPAISDMKKQETHPQARNVRKVQQHLVSSWEHSFLLFSFVIRSMGCGGRVITLSVPQLLNYSMELRMVPPSQGGCED